MSIPKIYSFSSGEEGSSIKGFVEYHSVKTADKSTESEQKIKKIVKHVLGEQKEKEKKVARIVIDKDFKNILVLDDQGKRINKISGKALSFLKIEPEDSEEAVKSSENEKEFIQLYQIAGFDEESNLIRPTVFRREFHPVTRMEKFWNFFAVLSRKVTTHVKWKKPLGTYAFETRFLSTHGKQMEKEKLKTSMMLDSLAVFLKGNDENDPEIQILQQASKWVKKVENFEKLSVKKREEAKNVLTDEVYQAFEALEDGKSILIPCPSGGMGEDSIGLLRITKKKNEEDPKSSQDSLEGADADAGADAKDENYELEFIGQENVEPKTAKKSELTKEGFFKKVFGMIAPDDSEENQDEDGSNKIKQRVKRIFQSRSNRPEARLLRWLAGIYLTKGASREQREVTQAVVELSGPLLEMSKSSNKKNYQGVIDLLGKEEGNKDKDKEEDSVEKEGDPSLFARAFQRPIDRVIDVLTPEKRAELEAQSLFEFYYLYEKSLTTDPTAREILQDGCQRVASLYSELNQTKNSEKSETVTQMISLIQEKISKIEGQSRDRTITLSTTSAGPQLPGKFAIPIQLTSPKTQLDLPEQPAADPLELTEQAPNQSSALTPLTIQTEQITIQTEQNRKKRADASKKLQELHLCKEKFNPCLKKLVRNSKTAKSVEDKAKSLAITRLQEFEKELLEIREFSEDKEFSEKIIEEIKELVEWFLKKDNNFSDIEVYIKKEAKILQDVKKWIYSIKDREAEKLIKHLLENESNLNFLTDKTEFIKGQKNRPAEIKECFKSLLELSCKKNSMYLEGDNLIEIFNRQYSSIMKEIDAKEVSEIKKYNEMKKKLKVFGEKEEDREILNSKILEIEALQALRLKFKSLKEKSGSKCLDYLNSKRDEEVKLCQEHIEYNKNTEKLEGFKRSYLNIINSDIFKAFLEENGRLVDEIERFYGDGSEAKLIESLLEKGVLTTKELEKYREITKPSKEDLLSGKIKEFENAIDEFFKSVEKRIQNDLPLVSNPDLEQVKNCIKSCRDKFKKPLTFDQKKLLDHQINQIMEQLPFSELGSFQTFWSKDKEYRTVLEELKALIELRGDERNPTADVQRALVEGMLFCTYSDSDLASKKKAAQSFFTAAELAKECLHSLTSPIELRQLQAIIDLEKALKEEKESSFQRKDLESEYTDWVKFQEDVVSFRELKLESKYSEPSQSQTKTGDLANYDKSSQSILQKYSNIHLDAKTESNQRVESPLADEYGLPAEIAYRIGITSSIPLDGSEDIREGDRKKATNQTTLSELMLYMASDEMADYCKSNDTSVIKLRRIVENRMLRPGHLEAFCQDTEQVEQVLAELERAIDSTKSEQGSGGIQHNVTLIWMKGLLLSFLRDQHRSDESRDKYDKKTNELKDLRESLRNKITCETENLKKENQLNGCYAAYLRLFALEKRSDLFSPKTIDEEDLSFLMESWIIYKNSKESLNYTDKTEEGEITRLFYGYILPVWKDAQKNKQEEILKDVLIKKGLFEEENRTFIRVKRIKIEGKETECYSLKIEGEKPVLLNPISGEIIQGGKRVDLQSNKEEIKTKLLKDFPLKIDNLDQISEFESKEDGKFYTFSFNGRKFRVEPSSGSNSTPIYFVQVKNKKGEDHWYQYTPLTPYEKKKAKEGTEELGAKETEREIEKWRRVATGLGERLVKEMPLKQEEKDCLPKDFKEGGIWIDTQKSKRGVILDSGALVANHVELTHDLRKAMQDGKKCRIVRIKKITQTPEEGTELHLVNSPRSTLYNHLCGLTAPENIKLWADQNNKVQKVELLEPKMHFEIDENGNLQSSDIKGFFISKDQGVPIGNFHEQWKNYLVLENQKGERKLIMRKSRAMRRDYLTKTGYQTTLEMETMLPPESGRVADGRSERSYVEIGLEQVAEKGWVLKPRNLAANLLLGTAAMDAGRFSDAIGFVRNAGRSGTYSDEEMQLMRALIDYRKESFGIKKKLEGLKNASEDLEGAVEAYLEILKTEEPMLPHIAAVKLCALATLLEQRTPGDSSLQLPDPVEVEEWINIAINPSASRRMFESCRLTTKEIRQISAHYKDQVKVERLILGNLSRGLALKFQKNLDRNEGKEEGGVEEEKNYLETEFGKKLSNENKEELEKWSRDSVLKEGLKKISWLMDEPSFCERSDCFTQFKKILFDLVEIRTITSLEWECIRLEKMLQSGSGQSGGASQAESEKQRPSGIQLLFSPQDVLGTSDGVEVNLNLSEEDSVNLTIQPVENDRVEADFSDREKTLKATQTKQESQKAKVLKQRKEIRKLANRYSKGDSELAEKLSDLAGGRGLGERIDVEAVFVAYARGEMDALKKNNPNLTDENIENLRKLVTEHHIEATKLQLLDKQVKAMENAIALREKLKAFTKHPDQKVQEAAKKFISYADNKDASGQPIEGFKKFLTGSRLISANNFNSEEFVQNIRQYFSELKSFVELGETKRYYDPRKDNDATCAALAYEYQLGVIFRENQIEEFMNRVGTPNIASWLGTGFGKTFMAPGLAQMMADGKNLVCILDTQDLIPTTAKTRDEASREVYQQAAYRFHFQRSDFREDKNNPEKSRNAMKDRLIEMKYQILKTIANKDYLVFSKNDIGSLVLQMHSWQRECIENPDEKQKERFADHIALAQDIVRIFKERSVVLADEIHLILNVKEALDFAEGDPVLMDRDPEFYEAAAVFNEVIFSKQNQEILEALQIRSNDQAKVPKAIIAAQMKVVAGNIVKKALEQPEDSSVQEGEKKKKNVYDCIQYLLRDGSQLKEEDLVEFLTQTTFESERLEELQAKMETAFGKMDEAEKKQIGSLRTLLISTLPGVMSKIIDVDFTCNPDKGHGLEICPADRGKAQPNRKFDDIFQTIQTHFMWYNYNGIPQEGLESLIEQWQIELKNEQSKFKKAEKCPTDQKFQRIFGGFFPGKRLSDLTSKDVEEIAKEAKKHPDLISNFLKEVVFPNQKIYTQRLGFNAMDIASSFSKLGGYSGTIESRETWSQAVSNKSQVDLDAGAEENFKQVYTQEQNQDQYTLTDLNPSGELSSVTEQLEKGKVELKEFRAIIDAGGLFKDFRAFDMAKDILEGFSSEELDAVLIYDEKGRLMILRRGADRLEPFDSKMVPPELNKRFTVYRQPQFTGADIPQAQHARALVTINEKTTWSDFQQAVGRMRKNKSGQGYAVAYRQSIRTAIERNAESAKKAGETAEKDRLEALIVKSDQIVEEVNKAGEVDKAGEDDDRTTWLRCVHSRQTATGKPKDVLDIRALTKHVESEGRKQERYQAAVLEIENLLTQKVRICLQGPLWKSVFKEFKDLILKSSMPETEALLQIKSETNPLQSLERLKEQFIQKAQTGLEEIKNKKQRLENYDNPEEEEEIPEDEKVLLLEYRALEKALSDAIKDLRNYKLPSEEALPKTVIEARNEGSVEVEVEVQQEVQQEVQSQSESEVQLESEFDLNLVRSDPEGELLPTWRPLKLSSIVTDLMGLNGGAQGFRLLSDLGKKNDYFSHITLPEDTKSAAIPAEGFPLDLPLFPMVAERPSSKGSSAGIAAKSAKITSSDKMFKGLWVTPNMLQVRNTKNGSKTSLASKGQKAASVAEISVVKDGKRQFCNLLLDMKDRSKFEESLNKARKIVNTDFKENLGGLLNEEVKGVTLKNLIDPPENNDNIIKGYPLQKIEGLNLKKIFDSKEDAEFLRDFLGGDLTLEQLSTFAIRVKVGGTYTASCGALDCIVDSNKTEPRNDPALRVFVRKKVLCGETHFTEDELKALEGWLEDEYLSDEKLKGQTVLDRIKLIFEGKGNKQKIKRLKEFYCVYRHAVSANADDFADISETDVGRILKEKLGELESEKESPVQNNNDKK